MTHEFVMYIDPALWTEEQVQNWVNWTIDQYKLPSSKGTRLWITGRRLCELSEAEIRALAPESGDFLHAHLEIWKTGLLCGFLNGSV